MIETTAEPTAAEPVRSGSTYRPHLDGIRAVAVYLVVLFHAGLTQFTGGYIGVDVFFVLSGYLVTEVLLRDLAAGGRSVRFGRFYARRFRRLLPAAFATLIATALVFAAVTPSAALASIRSFQAAFLYVANWHFINESTSYFATGVARNPVQQFWSLAVEEQFYLAWPLALSGLFWIASRRRRGRRVFVSTAVAVGALASVTWALYLRTGNLDRAYFGTDTRAYQLLAGASLALAPGLVASLGRRRRAMRAAAVVGIGAIIALACSLTGLDPIVRGVAVTVAAVVAIVGLEGADGGLVQRTLSSEPVVYLGKISYGTYLWHWPIVLLAVGVLDLSPGVVAWSTCLVATAIASLSFHLLERPVRASVLLDRRRVAVIGAGLAISAVSAFVLIPAVIDPGSTATAAPSSASKLAFTPVPSWIDTNKIYLEGFGEPVKLDGGSPNPPSCVGAAPDRCTVVHGSGPHLLLMGDSNAQMMLPTFTKIARDHDLSLSLEVVSGCPWQRGLYINGGRDASAYQAIQRRCRDLKEDAYTRVIPALHPDVIILVTAGNTTNPRLADELLTTTAPSLAQLAKSARDLVVMEPNPVPENGMDPRLCLETAKWLEDCRYVPSAAPRPYETLTRRLDRESEHVWSADFDRLVCPYLPICDPVVNGVVVKWDAQHLTTRFARSLAGPVATYLRDNGLIPR